MRSSIQYFVCMCCLHMPHVILGLITLPIQVKSTKYEYCHIKSHLATNELLLHILHI